MKAKDKIEAHNPDSGLIHEEDLSYKKKPLFGTEKGKEEFENTLSKINEKLKPLLKHSKASLWLHELFRDTHDLAKDLHKLDKLLRRKKNIEEIDKLREYIESKILELVNDLKNLQKMEYFKEKEVEEIEQLINDEMNKVKELHPMIESND